MESKYTANLYYHGRLDQQLYGDNSSRLSAQLRLYIERLATGAAGTIVDKEKQKIVYSCAYQAAE